MLVTLLSAANAVVACGTGWQGDDLVFSVIIGAEAVVASAQA